MGFCPGGGDVGGARPPCQDWGFSGGFQDQSEALGGPELGLGLAANGKTQPGIEAQGIVIAHHLQGPGTGGPGPRGGIFHQTPPDAAAPVAWLDKQPVQIGNVVALQHHAEAERGAGLFGNPGAVDMGQRQLDRFGIGEQVGPVPLPHQRRAALQLFQVLPFCGALIALVGDIFLLIQGLAVAHRISIGKATLAVLLPLVLCCICFSALLVTMGAAIMAHMPQEMQH